MAPIVAHFKGGPFDGQMIALPAAPPTHTVPTITDGVVGTTSYERAALGPQHALYLCAA